MNARTLILLAVIAAVLVAGAVWVNLRDEPAAELGSGEPLLPGLVERVNEVERIVVTAAGDETVATIEREGDGFVMREKNGYAVDPAPVRTLLLALAQAKRQEAKTADPERHARLGVQDVSAEDAAGVRVDVAAGGETTSVIVGDAASGGGSYVRRADETQSWLLDREIDVPREASAWLRRQIVDLPANRIHAVTIEHGDDRVELAGADVEGDRNFAIVNLPSGREPQSEYVAEATAGLLGGLNLDDVRAAGDTAAPDDAEVTQARWVTQDGVAVSLTAWKEGDVTWARLDAAVDEDRATAAAKAAQERAIAEHERALEEATVAADARVAQAGEAAAQDGATSSDAASDAVQAPPADAADAPPSAPEPPLAVTDPDADLAQRLETVEQEVAGLDARFEGWEFALPAFKVSNLDKRLEDYLKPKQ